MAAVAGGDQLTVAPAGDRAVADAVLRCVARRGVRKTTLDHVASEAGCSRATLYRAFPGGKDAVMAFAAEAEIERLLAELDDALRRPGTLEDVLVVALVGASRALLHHQALGYVLAHEPDLVRPLLAFDRLDPVLARAVGFLAPHLEAHLDGPAARQTAEWLARLVLLYADPGAPFDLTDPDDARTLVTTHVLPAFTNDAPQEHSS